LLHLTPVEALRAAITAGQVRQAAYRWGPSLERAQHRLNNLSALVKHAETYVDQCASRNEPATTAGLVLWLNALADAGRDTQASGGDEAAIQLVTHHGAKGLEWPLVIAMDLESKLRPRLWGLSVIPRSSPVSLDDPLSGRRLRYWPKFSGAQTTGVAILEQIDNSEAGQAAMRREVDESRRLLYVSLTRPRDGLIITSPAKKSGGPWMETLGADWMLPTGDSMVLPSQITIRTAVIQAQPEAMKVTAAPFNPSWLGGVEQHGTLIARHLRPSAAPAQPGAGIGRTVELGQRLEITGEYDPSQLGSALHAIIAARLMGQASTERILGEYALENTITPAQADLAATRFLDAIEAQFSPRHYFPEHPLQYTNHRGQRVSGWIDLLLETDAGLVIIDHKASPRARSDWAEIALSYSGQLSLYASGAALISGTPVHSCWIHFAVTGGMLELTGLD
jgi:ATP-dependent helicase/nuclease subunit A